MNQWTWFLHVILCLHRVLHRVFHLSHVSAFDMFTCFNLPSFKPIALTSPSCGFTVTTRTPPDGFIDTAYWNYAQPSLEAWYFLIFYWYLCRNAANLKTNSRKEPTCDRRRWWRRYQVQDLFPILRNPSGWDELPACRTSSHTSIQLQVSGTEK